MCELGLTRLATLAACGGPFDLPTFDGVLDTLLRVVRASRFHGLMLQCNSWHDPRALFPSTQMTVLKCFTAQFHKE